MHRTILTALLLLLLAAPWAGAGETRCDTCGDPIEGRYIRTDTGVFCSQECYEASLPTCDECGEPMETFYEDGEGRHLCPACHQARIPRCERCGAKITRWVEILGHRYCFRCGEKPRCSACGLPRHGDRYPDGRLICEDCHRTAVLNAAEAKRLFGEVRDRMDRALGLATDHEIAFELVSRSELAERGGGDGLKELGLFRMEEKTWTRRDARRRGRASVEVERRYYIDILYGLPRVRFRGVAAHELAHDYEREHFPGLAPALSEGWAEYVATLVQGLYGGEEWNRLVEANTDPVYGDGFRRVLRMARARGGLPGLVRHLRELARDRR